MLSSYGHSSGQGEILRSRLGVYRLPTRQRLDMTWDVETTNQTVRLDRTAILRNVN